MPFMDKGKEDEKSEKYKCAGKINISVIFTFSRIPKMPING